MDRPDVDHVGFRNRLARRLAVVWLGGQGRCLAEEPSVPPEVLDRLGVRGSQNGMETLTQVAGIAP